MKLVVSPNDVLEIVSCRSAVCATTTVSAALNTGRRRVGTTRGCRGGSVTRGPSQRERRGFAQACVDGTTPRICVSKVRHHTADRIS